MEGVFPEALRLYVFLKQIKWSHLPVAGGLYDQHPMFLDQMFELMQLDIAQQNREHKAAEAKAKRKR